MRGSVTAAAAMLALLAGCDRRPAPAAPTTSAARADPDFRTPPTVTAADRDDVGGVTLRGRAQPGADVSLHAPDGGAFSVRATADGAWNMRLPPDPAPRAFALAAMAGGRIVRGEGALLVAPPPFAAATLLRGGAPALPVSAPGAGLRWTSADTDPGGGAAASGFAPPGAALRLAIDGVVRGEGTADASGRFGVLWLGGAVPPGPHAITVSTPAGVRSATLPFGAAALGGAPVRVTREAEGWRIDWAPPGGGAQTLHLLAPAPESPR